MVVEWTPGLLLHESAASVLYQEHNGQMKQIILLLLQWNVICQGSLISSAGRDRRSQELLAGAIAREQSPCQDKTPAGV